MHMYGNSMDKVVTLLAIFLKAKLWNTPLLLLLGAISKVQDQTSWTLMMTKLHNLLFLIIKTVLS